MKNCFFALLRQYKVPFFGFFLSQIVLTILIFMNGGFYYIQYFSPFYFFTVVAYSIPSKLTSCLELGSSRKEIFGGCSLFMVFCMVYALITFYIIQIFIVLMQLVIYQHPLSVLFLPTISSCFDQFETYFLLMLPSFWVGIFIPKKSNVNPWLVGLLLLVSYGCIYNFGTTFSDLSTNTVVLMAVLVFCITEALLWVETKKLSISN